MNAALVVTDIAPARPLSAWLAAHLRRRPRRRPSRAEVAELHERRMAAARLRDEQYASIAIGRLI